VAATERHHSPTILETFLAHLAISDGPLRHRRSQSDHWQLKMRVFQDNSLKKRLRKVIALTGAIALTMACIAICVFQFVEARRETVYQLTWLAKLIEANSTAALMFQNPKETEEILRSLKTNPEILSACVYRSDGNLFAQYVRVGTDAPPLPAEHLGEGHWFENWQLILSRRIRLGSQTLGSVVLRRDLHEQYTRLRDYVLIVAILMLASTCAAFLLTIKFQNAISGPILELARVASGITEKKDYSLRAEGRRKDEVGLLVNAFNQMLDQIQERDGALRKAYAELEKSSRELEIELGERQRAEERFSQLAESINEVFWMTNVEKTEMVYISPGYEQIWGRTCESLYKSPMNWMEAIHLEDRERVWRAALSKQAHGTYDEEYRIVRPSGAVRWIRDRAFPILDKQGKPYRVAGIAEDVTERKLAEEELRLQSEIAHNMDEGVLLVRDADSGIIYANPKFEGMFGYEPGELKDKHISVLTAENPSRAEENLQEILRALDKSGRWSGELFNRRKDGTEFWTFATISGFEHRDYGRVRVSVETDVTEQKRAAAAVEKLAAIVESTDDAIISASVDGTIVSWNSSAERIFGFTEKEVIGRPVTFIAPPDRENEAVDRLRRVLDGERTQAIETFRLHKDGRRIPVSLTLSPVRERHGRIVGASAIIRDITVRKRAEEELRLQGEITRNLQEGVVLVRASDAVIVYTNPKYARIFGYAPGELIGKSVVILNAGSEEAARQTADEIIGALNKTGNWTGELVNRRKDGTEFWSFLHVTTFEHPDHGPVWIAVQSDITERKHAELKLRQAEEKYRLLVERVPAITYIAELGQSGRWHYISPQVETLLGFSPEQWMVDRDLWFRQVHPDDRAAVLATDEQSLVSGRYSSEYRLLARDGHIVWCRDEGVVVHGSSGEPPLLQGVIYDITERKLAELQLTTLGHAVEGTAELICITDLEDRFIFVNRAFGENHGYTKEEILGKTPEILHSPHNPPSLLAEVLKQTRLGGWRGEVLDRRKDGTEFPVYLSTSLVKDSTGKVIGLMGVAQDITERKRVQESLRAMAAVVENTDSFVGICTPDMKPIFLNEAGRRMVGLNSMEEVMQTRVPDYFWHEDRPRIEAEAIPTLQRTGRWSGEVRFRHFKTGAPIPTLWNAFIIRDDKGQPVAWATVSPNLTELKRAEQAMRAQRQEEQAILNSVPALIWYKDCHNRILRLNESAAASIGKTVAEMEDTLVEDLYPDDAAKYYQDDLEVINSGQPKLGIVEQLPTASGERRWMQADKAPFFNERGELIGLIVCRVDITERMHAAEALRQSEERLQAIIDNSTAVIYLKDREGKYLLINHRYETLFGVTREQMVGKTDYDVFPRKNADEFHKNDLLVLAKKAPIQFEEVAPHPDGLHTYVSVKFPFLDTAGKPYAVCGISTDITERKKAEQALQTQARILENMDEGVLVYDAHEHILLTNPALDAMFGYARGELIGKSTFGLNPFPPETGAQIAGEIRSLLQTQPSLVREFLNRRKDGTEFISESRISKLQIDGQWCQVSVVQDVTKRKRMEKEIVEISDREQRRIGQDLHDGLSQLLTGTAFAGKVLEERLAAKSSPEVDQAAKVVALLEQATSEARRVARGLHPVQLEVGGLTSALQELASSVQALFRVACKFNCSDPVPIQDTAVATHVYRIAQEAVNNAVRHSDGRQINIGLTQRRNTVTLTVVDDGKGLPEKLRTGTGMGLNIMAYRAQLIGGTFQVERRAKGGTRVACSFKIE
jgi:PAS domain S-box-containing protein